MTTRCDVSFSGFGGGRVFHFFFNEFSSVRVLIMAAFNEFGQLVGWLLLLQLLLALRTTEYLDWTLIRFLGIMRIYFDKESYEIIFFFFK